MEYSWGTQWGRSVFGMPSTVAVICPRCAREATFQPPFEFFPEETPGAEDMIRWNNCRVRERFSTLFPWADPDNPFKSLFWGTPKRKASEYPIWGVLRCGQCTLLRKHRLAWPDDAFYSVSVEGRVLWAWDRTSLIQVRDHIAATLRSKRSHPLLKYLPRHFLVGKHRAAVSKAVNSKLACGDAQPCTAADGFAAR